MLSGVSVELVLSATVSCFATLLLSHNSPMSAIPDPGFYLFFNSLNSCKIDRMKPVKAIHTNYKEIRNENTVKAVL